MMERSPIPDEEVLRQVEESFLAHLERTASLESGILTVGENSLSVGIILKEMDPEGYRSSMLAFIDAKREKLAMAIEQKYPMPVSFPVYLATNYADSNTHRMSYLKDAWESVIRFVHAVCFSEIRYRGTTVNPSENFSYKSVRSDSLHRLIVNIEAMLALARDTNSDLWVSGLSDDVLDHMKTLNGIRNTIAHSPSATETEAGSMLTSIESAFWSMMEGLPGLEDIQLFRCLALEGSNMRAEAYVGHGNTPRRTRIPINAQQLMKSYSLTPPPFDPQHLLAGIGGAYLCVSPFVHFLQSVDGRSVQMCLLRLERKIEDEQYLIYDVLGESKELVLPKSMFEDHFADLRRVFGLSEVS